MDRLGSSARPYRTTKAKTPRQHRYPNRPEPPHMHLRVANFLLTYKDTSPRLDCQQVVCALMLHAFQSKYFRIVGNRKLAFPLRRNFRVARLVRDLTKGYFRTRQT